MDDVDVVKELAHARGDRQAVAGLDMLAPWLVASDDLQRRQVLDAILGGRLTLPGEVGVIRDATVVGVQGIEDGVALLAGVRGRDCVRAGARAVPLDARLVHLAETVDLQVVGLVVVCGCSSGVALKQSADAWEQMGMYAAHLQISLDRTSTAELCHRPG